MENYSYPSYPDSGNSSPRSREVDFDNPPPWDDQQQPPNYKVKFMCSYGGKIHPRPHDNQLSYVGGETKILSVDRSIKLSSMIAKLSALCGDSDVSFKYQLPGEDLDALISVTNDDDLDHLMHEYDRLYRSTAKPARLRLFLFSASPSGSFGSGQAGSDRERFVEALNSGPVPDPPKAAAGNVDFLFGLERGAPPPPPPVTVVPDPVPAAVAVPDRGFGPEGVNPVEIQRQLQELQRMQISGQVQEAMQQRRKSDDNMVGGFVGGDYYLQKVPEKATPVPIPATVPQQVTAAPTNYWPEKQQFHGGQYPGPVTNIPAPTEQQPMYVVHGHGHGHGHGGVYHAPPMIRPVSGQPGQGYYAIHQNAYGVGPPPTQQQPPQLSMAAQQGVPPPQQMPKQVVEGMGAPRQGATMVSEGVTYTHMGFDPTVGRQVFYTAASGGVVGAPPQYQGMTAVTADMRPAGPVLGQEGKVVAKVTQASV